MRPPLVRLAGLMDWGQIERHFANHVTSGRGRPALAPRLVAGLLYRFAPVAAMQRLLPFALHIPKTGLSQERTPAKDRIKEVCQTVSHSRSVVGVSLEQLRGAPGDLRTYDSH